MREIDRLRRWWTLGQLSLERDLHVGTQFESHRKKSPSTLRAKRAPFTFWVDKRLSKMPKIVNFGEFLKTWSLRSKSVTRQVSFNRTKIGGKCQNSKLQNATFWVIFKQCVFLGIAFIASPLRLSDHFSSFSGLPLPIIAAATHTIRQRWITFSRAP